MGYADVQTLVALLSNGQYDSTLFPTLYNDVMAGYGPAKWLTTTATLTFTEGSTIVDLPATLLNILSIIYDDTVLSNLSLRELEALHQGAWRNVPGKPIAYTLESELVKSIEVYPYPTSSSPPNGTSIHAEMRTDVTPYLDLPTALKVLGREYIRESPHQDFAFGMLCEQLGNLLLELLK